MYASKVEYASKDGYLMDMNETNDIFSDQYEFQPILFLITIIMLTECYFGNMLGLNSYFQKLLITVNKITASINTLLPILLPATTQAATIIHGDAKLHVNYSDLLMYMIQNHSWLYLVLLFGYVYRFGTVLIQEILENYVRN